MNSLIKTVFGKKSIRPHADSMVIWLDPEKFIVGDTPEKISVLLDQSGNSHDISQSVPSLQPFNDVYIDSKRYIDFRASQYIQSQADFTTAHQAIGTHFVVVNNRFNAQKYITDGRDGGGRNLIAFGTIHRFQVWGGVDWRRSLGDVYSLNETIVISVIFEGFATKLYSNGVEIPMTGANIISPFKGLTLGARFSGTSPINASVGDYIYYNKKLTPQEINETGRYLARKYGTSYTDVL